MKQKRWFKPFSRYQEKYKRTLDNQEKCRPSIDSLKKYVYRAWYKQRVLELRSK